MSHPTLASCGHLFDSACYNLFTHCPWDKQPLHFQRSAPEVTREFRKWQNSYASLLLLKHYCSWLLREKNPYFQMKKIILSRQNEVLFKIIKVSSDIFVTASTNGCLKILDFKTNTYKQNSPYIADRNYPYFHTAVHPLDNETWVSGTNDGHLNFWNKEGRKSSFLYGSYEMGEYKYYGIAYPYRIYCISECPKSEGDLYLCTGSSRFLCFWNSSRLIKKYEATTREPISAVNMLDSNKLILVYGSKVEHWSLKNDSFPLKTLLLEETSWEWHSYARPYITSIVRLSGNESLLAVARENGNIRILDIDRAKLIHTLTEHKEMVWNVININPQLFASSSGDRTVKLWDLRMNQSITTLSNHPGRVSSMVSRNENQFIAASCPTGGRAALVFWDLRNTNHKK